MGVRVWQGPFVTTHAHLGPAAALPEKFPCLQGPFFWWALAWSAFLQAFSLCSWCLHVQRVLMGACGGERSCLFSLVRLDAGVQGDLSGCIDVGGAVAAACWLPHSCSCSLAPSLPAGVRASVSWVSHSVLSPRSGCVSFPPRPVTAVHCAGGMMVHPGPPPDGPVLGHGRECLTAEQSLLSPCYVVAALPVP